MYIPKQYTKEDYQEIKAFIQRHNFVTVISTVEGRPIATHVPVNVQEDEETFIYYRTRCEVEPAMANIRLWREYFSYFSRASCVYFFYLIRR